MIYLVFLIALPILTIWGCICAKNKTIKILLGILSGSIIFVLMLLLFLLYSMNYAITDVDSKTSDDGAHSVIMQSVGSPIFFSAADGRFVLKEGKKTIVKYNFTLYDDGAVIRSSIWEVTWKNDSVRIIVSGSEQADHLYELYFDGHVEDTQLDTQYDGTVGNNSDSNSANDADGYPLTDEFQSYKKQMAAIYAFITSDTTDFPCEYFLNAKGWPYAVIARDTEEFDGNVAYVERRLVYNESYQEDGKQEYVYEEFYFYEDGSEAKSTRILDFFLIDTKSFDITDENRTKW